MFQNEQDDPTYVVLPEAALLLRKKTLQLSGPHEASVDHACMSCVCVCVCMCVYVCVCVCLWLVLL